VNFATVPVPVRLPAGLPRRSILLLCTDPDRAAGDVDLDGFTLGSSEAVLLLVQQEDGEVALN
jgi:hypothetical protein